MWSHNTLPVCVFFNRESPQFNHIISHNLMSTIWLVISSMQEAIVYKKSNARTHNTYLSTLQCAQMVFRAAPVLDERFNNQTCVRSTIDPFIVKSLLLYCENPNIMLCGPPSGKWLSHVTYMEQKLRNLVLKCKSSDQVPAHECLSFRNKSQVDETTAAKTWSREISENVSIDWSFHKTKHNSVRGANLAATNRLYVIRDIWLSLDQG